MRTLNRPMFRYGGPIKEGIMDGIREPKKHGGSMGTRQAALVGNPAYPQTAGREHHKANVVKKIIGVGSKDVAAKPGFITSQLSKLGDTKIVDRIKNFYNKNTTKIPKYKYVDDGYMIKETPMLQRAMQFAKANPKQTAAGAGVGVSSGVAGDVVGGIANLAENVVLQGTDILLDDKYFDQDKYMEKKYPGGFLNSIFGGKAKKDAELAAAKNNKLNTNIQKLLDQPVKPKKSEKEIRAEQIAKYRDIVDIKGMNKDAAYNSLIAASQAISGEGDFKGSLKDGSLINKIIGSTSKAFDKPKATKDAIDTLILKGEIEKDMNKDKNAIMDAYRMKQIALADKQLSGGGFAENKGVLAKTMSGQTLFDTAAAKSSTNFMGNLMTKKDLTDLMTEAKKKGDLVERDIIINTTETLIKGKGIPNGDYTVGDVLVTIVEGKVANVTR